MKLHKYITGVLLGTLLSTSSCTDQLMVEPTSVITNASFWKTEDDAKGGLAGMYVKLRNEAQLNLFIYGEGRSEIMQKSLAGTLDYDRYYLNTLNQAATAPDWIGLYSAVNAANLILKYVPGITFKSETVKNSTLAQAYAMRAFLYFVMVRTWGDLPLRTEPTEGYDPQTTFLDRSPASAVLTFIKEDIEKALQLFPDNAFTNGRSMWSKPSLNALKADVYLWTAKRANGGQADFTTALNACDEVAKADVSLLSDFSSIFKYGNKGNKEILLSVAFRHLESPNNYFDNMYMAVGALPANVDDATKAIVGVSGGNNVWEASALVRNQFVADDQRRNGSFHEIYTNGANGTRNYFISVPLKGQGLVEGGVRFFVDDIILYRYADVLLMKAEAKNGLGQDPSAEINQVRQRAYGTKFDAYKFVNGTKDANDAAILKERLLELIFEGKRWWDLVRFGKAFDLVPSLQAQKGKDHLVLFPLSSNVLSLEPKITQNPGY
ncbi:RagB/SusD family nutrient uptake outer membrane protein [Larkinella insperata]|uniref:RagB/SusD family nutrient uptake outer membrane protein n=1 Tax=Larkinella insperata TaxID=332158 RepID=A0ABW3PZ55_9BACT|nr:RagB/SusD family nutrient uptake outer membrane protein [Larkinella insperata]